MWKEPEGAAPLTAARKLQTACKLGGWRILPAGLPRLLVPMHAARWHLATALKVPARTWQWEGRWLTSPTKFITNGDTGARATSCRAGGQAGHRQRQRRGEGWPATAMPASLGAGGLGSASLHGMNSCSWPDSPWREVPLPARGHTLAAHAAAVGGRAGGGAHLWRAALLDHSFVEDDHLIGNVLQVRRVRGRQGRKRRDATEHEAAASA